jgi:O-methyltransferase
MHLKKVTADFVDTVLSPLRALGVKLEIKRLPQNALRQKLMRKLIGTPPEEASVLLKHLHASLSLQGDVCEFGVAQGATSALLANEIANTNKALWLFDSFEGLPKPSEKDDLLDDILDLGSMSKYEGRMSFAAIKAKKRLQKVNFPPERVKIVEGFIEQTALQKELPERVCFAYLDFDFYEGTRIVLNLLKTRLSAGGTVMVDDYGWFSSGAQKAVDEFMQSNANSFEFFKPSRWIWDKSSVHYCLLRKKRDS